MEISPKAKMIGSFIIVAFLIVLFFIPRTENNAVKSSAFSHPLVVGTTSLTVAYASLPPEQQQGLSGTSSLDPNQGMLFLFPSAINQSFWMKDMHYPLDIIWIGSDKKVIDISKNLDPKSYPKTFSPKAPAQYVLEVNAGFTDSNNIVEGTVVSF